MEEVPRAQCLAETGRQPIGTRWVDTNKGDDAVPSVRSRMVARELNMRSEFELFAATPPIDSIPFLLSCAASGQGGVEKSFVMIVDVNKRPTPTRRVPEGSTYSYHPRILWKEMRTLVVY